MLTVGMPRTSRDDAPIPVSEELFAPVTGGVELCYQTFGDPDDEPVLLVMGLGGPMTWWDPAFCTMLAERGCYVIRYDNRDTGRSTKIKERVRRSTLMRAFAGRAVRAPYSLGDMAEDAVGLLDHLGLDGAHVVGISMGGMIAQTLALDHPDRVASLTSIMSTTGKRSVGWQHPRLLPMLIAPRAAGRDAYAEGSARMWQAIGSPAYPQPHDEVISRAHETFDRGISASGVMRQMLAILAEGNRGQRLRSLKMPTLVIHGAEDKMVHVSGGRATARAVPGAELLVIDGMGHDLPAELYPTFIDAIHRTLTRRPAVG